MRLVSANTLHVDEAILTGESLEVLKDCSPMSASGLPVMDQRNMVFKGTYVLRGSGKGIVIAIGASTEVGKIHASAQEIQTEIPIKKELNRLSIWILIFVLSVCFILFIAGIVTGKPFKELLVTLTALFICVVPEGLPVVLTLVLVSGVYRMARLRVLVKKMQAVETLGRTDIIVIDKTGTLTRNEMMVNHVYADGMHWHVTGQGYYQEGRIYKKEKQVTQFESYPNLMILGKACMALSNAQISQMSDHDRFTIKGDPTEAAMAILGSKLGLSKEKVEKEFIKIGEIPFDSRLKYHAVICRHDDKGIIFVAGAPETVCNWVYDLPSKTKTELGDFLQQGLRVIAVAHKSVDLRDLDQIDSHRDAVAKVVSQGLKFVGLCGIQDAIRPGVARVIEQTRDAGLRIIMATGDHQKTALYVAKTVGIFKEGDRVIEGQALEALPEIELKKQLPFITVYSRVIACQ